MSKNLFDLVLVADFETQYKEQKDIAVVATIDNAHLIRKTIRNDNFLISDYIITKSQNTFICNYGKSIIKEFLDTIFNWNYEDYEFNKVYVYFHNLRNFDGWFLINYLLTNFNNKMVGAKLENKDFSILFVNNLIYEIKIKYNDKNFLIRDSVNYFTNSLENMGKLINVYKDEKVNYDLDLDYHMKNNTHEFLIYKKYALQDTVVLREFINKNLIATSKNITKRLSNVGFNFALFLKNNEHLKKDLFINNKNFAWDYAFLSLYGGYTRLNKNYACQVINNVDYYDINSSYPAIMCGELVYGHYLKTIPKENYTTLFSLIFKKGKLKKDYQPIIRNPSVKKRIRTYACYTEHFVSEITVPFDYYIWAEELDYVKLFYEDLEYEIKEEFYYPKKVIFKDFIENKYENRLLYKDLAKKETNEDKKVDYELKQLNEKTEMNSIFGKFCEAINKPLRVFVKKEFLDYERLKKRCEYNNYVYYNEKNETYSFENDNSNDTTAYIIIHIHSMREKYYELTLRHGYYNDEKKETQRRNISVKNCAIASYITMKGRLKIFEQISYLKDKFIYCDTDSIMFVNNNEELHFKVDKKILGKWKPEATNMFLLALAQKQYILSNSMEINKDTKITFCGYNNFNDIYNFKNLNDLLENEILLSKIKVVKSEYGKHLDVVYSKLSIKDNQKFMEVIKNEE